MLSADRQTKLNPILTALATINGVTQVVQDDFDSHSVRVQINLPHSKHSVGGLNLSRPITALKKNIRQVIDAHQIHHQFSNWPRRLPSIYNGTMYGKKLYIPQGFDMASITVDIFV